MACSRYASHVVLTHRSASSFRSETLVSRHKHWATSSAQTGVTLIETAVVMVIAGLLVQVMITGEELIRNARVRDILAQQSAAEAAVIAFQDRYRALPGDYRSASTNLACDPACLDGNGNGRIEAGSDGALHEEILAWHQLSAAKFIAGEYRMARADESSATYANTPRNVFGGFLQVASDGDWGSAGNISRRNNIKTGNYVPASVLAQVDKKIDDGLAAAGRFQFSRYAGHGPAPLAPGSTDGCVTADSASAAWLPLSPADNCGAATLLY